MMLLTTLLAGVGATAFFGGGYLLGARRGLESRDELRNALAAARSEADEQKSASEELRKRLTGAHAESDKLREAVNGASGESDKLRHALGTANGELDKLRQALAAAQRGADTKKVEQVLAPLLEKERLGRALAHLDIGRGTRDELPRFLEAIARTAGFTSVVVSDESGLPLASNEGADDAELLAGIWSMLLTIADRVAQNGAPAPLSIVVHDAEGRAILHRIFSAGRQRFLLTAVSRTDRLAPESLDPALANLERMLTRDAWQLTA